MNPTNHIELEVALQRIMSWTTAPRVLTLAPSEQNALRQAVKRAASQLLGETDNVLTIALAGCSGAGKSTLINALAGSSIARVTEERPCTNQVQVYHHSAVPKGGLPKPLRDAAIFVTHDRPELRFKVIVDTPDLDTFATENRDIAQALLKSAGLVIYVFSPEKYWEERAWSVIREEQRFSTAIAVLNKANTISPVAAEQLTDEIRRRFAEIGAPAISVLRTCAVCHAPDHKGRRHPLPDGVLDEFATLRAYIEHELQEGDIGRMVQAQRTRVVDHVEAIIDQITPTNLPIRLADVQSAAEEQANAVSEALVYELTPRLEAVEEMLAPLAALHRQQLFWGPLRIWLAIIDFLCYGLPQAVRRLRFFRFSEEQSTDIKRLIVTGMNDVADRQLHHTRSILQDRCFANGLPVQYWQRQAMTTYDGTALLSRIAGVIQDHNVAAVTAIRHPKKIAWLLSLLSVLIPSAFLIFALMQIVRSLATLEIEVGYQVIGLVLIGLFLCQLLFSGLASALVPVRRSHTQQELAGQCVQQVVTQTLLEWVNAYRTEVEADVCDLRQPLRVMRATLDDSRLLPLQTEPALLFQSTQAVPHSSEAPLQIAPPILTPTPIIPPSRQETLPTTSVDEATNNPFLRGLRPTQRIDDG